MTNRLARTLVAVFLTMLALTACTDDTTPPVSDPAPTFASVPPTEDATISTGPIAWNDLPTVDFSDITDCRGQLGTVDATPVYQSITAFDIDEVGPPKNLGDKCSWLNDTFSVVTGYPETSAFLGDIDYYYENGTPIDDTAGYSAAWTADSTVTYAAIAPDGLALQCQFLQTGPYEEGADIQVKPEDMIDTVSAICAEVLERLTGEAEDRPETVDFSDLPEIPARFGISVIDTDCSAFDDLDTTDLLGVDTAGDFDAGDGASSCTFAASSDPSEPRVIFETSLNMGTPDGTHLNSRDIPSVSGWTSAVIQPGYSSRDDLDTRGVIEMKTVDMPALMFDVTCIYAGPANKGRLSDKQVMDQVEDRAAATVEFCTRALDVVVLDD